MAPKNATSPTHRALRPIRLSKELSYKPGDLISLTDEQAEELGLSVVEPYFVPVSEMTSEQLIQAAAEAKRREDAIITPEGQQLPPLDPDVAAILEDARISGSPMHLVAAKIAEATKPVSSKKQAATKTAETQPAEGTN